MGLKYSDSKTYPGITTNQYESIIGCLGILIIEGHQPKDGIRLHEIGDGSTFRYLGRPIVEHLIRESNLTY